MTDTKKKHDDGLVVVQAEAADVARSSATSPLLRPASLEELERQVAVYRRTLAIACKLTEPYHWVRRRDGERFSYALQGPGAEALANPFGIEWERPTITQHEHEDARGAYREFVVEGSMRCALLGVERWFVGSCDERDQFFHANARAQAIKERVAQTGRKPRHWRLRDDEVPFTDEDEAHVAMLTPTFLTIGNLRKSAFTNWLVNGVSRTLGIRNPTEELLRDAGLDVASVPGIEYDGGAASTSKPPRGAPRGKRSASKTTAFFADLYNKVDVGIGSQNSAARRAAAGYVRDALKARGATLDGLSDLERAKLTSEAIDAAVDAANEEEVQHDDRD